MQIIYRAFDGKEFNNKEDCCLHESKSMDGIVMLDVRGNVVQETRSGYLVWLRDESANLAFHALARLQGDNDVDSICEGEDYGLFYWDEGYGQYRWLDTDLINGLIKIKGIVEGKGGKLNV
jgi:hypothetical protein